MIRHLLLLLLALALAAGEDPAPTPLRWEAGKVQLSAALGRLAVGGNRVWLADGVDDTIEAQLPAVAGVWWDGVIAVCRAFDLRPDEGEAADEQGEQAGTPVPIGHGTLVLSPGRPPSLQAAGVLLAALEAEGGLRLWLRAEPRLPRGRFAWGRAETPVIEGQAAITMEAAEAAVHLPPAAAWRPSAPLAPEAQLSVAVQTAVLERWTARTTLKAGETVRFTAAGQELLAILALENTPPAWEGQNLAERRPLVAVLGPALLLGKAQYRLRQGENELGSRGSSSRTGEDGRTAMFRYLRAAPDGAVELEMEGREQSASQRCALRLPVPAPAPSAALAELPTRVSWEAGKRPLREWLALLAAGGNPVLPEVGIDTAQPVAVPAVQGGFWDALQAIATAAGLGPAPPSGLFGGGAVRLLQRPVATTSAVSGPLLVIAQAVPAGRGEVSMQLRLGLEPRLPEDGFGPPEFRWASWAVDEQGRAHEVAGQQVGPQPGTSTRMMMVGQAQMMVTSAVEEGGARTALPQVTVRLGAAGAKRLQLDGLITLPRLRVWRGTTELVADQPSEMLLGSRAIELTALTSAQRLGNTQAGPGLLLRGVHGAASVQFSLVTAEGETLEAPREANRLGGMQPGARPWLGWCRIPPQGRMTAEVAVRAARQPLVLPVRLTIPVPDGL